MRRILLAVALTTLLGCGGDDGNGDEGLCVPNQTVECICLDGNAGYQTCNESGYGFKTECVCTDTPDAGNQTPDITADVVEPDTTADVVEPDTTADVVEPDTTADVGGDDDDSAGDDDDSAAGDDVSTANLPPSCVAEARIGESSTWGVYNTEATLLGTIPLKTLELSAANSLDSDGGIVDYQWTVLERPNDSTAQVLPNAGAEVATFFLDLAGLYIFALEVTDNDGAVSNDANCQVVVAAVPDEAIYIQLVWDTPADSDQTDMGIGADMDLHLLHPLGDWFCPWGDTYYASPNPDWGVPFDPSDDPSLDIDDTDGAGPEVISLGLPEKNKVYRVGVHYFNDNGYGTSFATVRIFIQGVLQFELADKPMVATGAFWDVATIEWPSGNNTVIDNLSPFPPPQDCP